MKTTTYAPQSLAPHGAAASITSGLAAVSRFLAGVKAYADDRRMRAELAELDPMLLKDMGVDTDEIARVQSAEVFTPRAWRA